MREQKEGSVQMMINYLLHSFKEKTLKDEMHKNKHHIKTFHYIHYFLAHLSRRLTRWAYRMGLEPASVRPSVRACVRASVHTFKHEYLRDQQADYNQILSEASLG